MNAPRGLALSLALALCLTACASIAPTPQDAQSSAAASASTPNLSAVAFDGARARVHLAYIGDPAREGRLTGSRGFREAAEYVAARFREIGLVPAGGGGTYFQRFSTPVVELTAMPELAILAPDPVRFTPRADFTESVGGWQGAGAVETKLVYVGGGIDTTGYSDYRDVDPKGKVVLIAGPTQTNPIETAARLGAVGAILASRQASGPLIHFSYIPAFESGAIPTIVVTEPTADRLIASSGKHVADLRRTLEERRATGSPEPLSFEVGITIRLSVPLGPVRQVDGVNVVGVLPPAAGDARYLIVGGHLDGVGSDPDGTVFPGANDNGSGSAILVELARVAPTARERRHGVVFVAFTGEEEGSRGALEFLRRSADTPYRSENVLAMVNLDVVGCCGDTLLVAGQNQGLVQRFAAAAQRNDVRLSSSRGVSSDHVVFERQGLPAVTLLWRESGPIHTPADSLEKVDVEHLRRAGVVATGVVLELAEAP